MPQKEARSVRVESKATPGQLGEWMIVDDKESAGGCLR
jgi:hypothetical protein